FASSHVYGLRQRCMVASLGVNVYTGVSRVLFDEGLCDELAGRLERFGAPDAARQLRDSRSVRQENKPVVREVVGRWRQSLGTAPFAEQLWDLERELGRGLAPWPAPTE